MSKRATAQTQAGASPARTLPARAGVGLKPEHFQEILATLPDIGFFEVHEPCPTRYEPERLAYFHPGMSPKRLQ